jgi:predicted unusual protein kinase regulating ubiquinone biosynthesis (AarF/ABC1/UbiB family)
VTIRQRLTYFLFILPWLAFFSPLGHAADEEILIRGVAADFVEILGLPETAQPPALRKFAVKHRETLEILGSAHSPGKAILDSRLFQSPVGWSTEQDKIFTKAIDSTLKDPNFLHLLAKAGDRRIGVPDEALAWLAAESTAQFARMKISEQPGFKSILDPKKGVKFANQDLKKIATEMLPRFYDSLPVPSKTKIIAAVLRLKPDASPTMQASEVLQNSGPISQKLFQLIGRESNSPEMAKVLEALQANIQPVPRDEIVSVVESRTGKQMSEIFSDFSEPVSSGTVGQVHYAVAKDTGEEVAVNVRRPGAMKAYQAEVSALKAVTRGTPSEKFVEKVEVAVGRELNFLQEALNLRSGEVYISEKKGISLAKIVDKFQPYEDFLVMKKAEGTKINKFVTQKELLKRGEAMSSLLETWTRQAVFRDGFFHGDLHPGNLFFEPNAGSSKGYRLTILDFGNAGRISLDQQRGFLKMSAAVALRSPEDALAAIEAIGKVPAESRSLILADLRIAMATPPSYPLNDWFKGIFDSIMQSCLSHKVDVPDSFLAFQRGKAFLEIELSEINRLLDALDPKHKLKRFDAAKILARSMAKELPSIPKSLIKAERVKNTVLTYDLLRDIARMWSNSFYRGRSFDMCKDFYRALKTPRSSKLEGAP